MAGRGGLILYCTGVLRLRSQGGRLTGIMSRLATVTDGTALIVKDEVNAVVATIQDATGNHS